MRTHPILCDGPGPHDPADGVLGTADRPVSARCGSDACRPQPAPEQVNSATLRDRAEQALATNRTFIAKAKPGTAAAQASDAYDQAKALSRQNVALIRLLLGKLEGTD